MRGTRKSSPRTPNIKQLETEEKILYKELAVDN